MAADARRVGNGVLDRRACTVDQLIWVLLPNKKNGGARRVGKSGRAQSGRRLLGLMSKATPQVETAEGGWSGAKEKEWPVSATPDSMVKVAPW